MPIVMSDRRPVATHGDRCNAPRITGVPIP